MQAVELPLFGIDESLKSSRIITQPEPEPKITQEQILSSTVEILEKTTVNPPESKLDSVDKSLKSMFPEQEYEEKSLQEARKILGTIADEYSTEGLKNALTEIQFLASTWLDDFERETFNGLTLNELLHEKGSG